MRRMAAAVSWSHCPRLRATGLARAYGVQACLRAMTLEHEAAVHDVCQGSALEIAQCVAEMDHLMASAEGLKAMMQPASDDLSVRATLRAVLGGGCAPSSRPCPAAWPKRTDARGKGLQRNCAHVRAWKWHGGTTPAP